MSKLSGEDLEIENVDRAERLLMNKYGDLSMTLVNSFNKIRESLVEYEVDQRLLDRISDVMYSATLVESVKDAELSIKYLADTFWQQNY